MHTESGLSQLDTLILDNLKLQAQVVTQAAEIASLRARLSVQELQAKHDAHLQKIVQQQNDEVRSEAAKEQVLNGHDHH